MPKTLLVFVAGILEGGFELESWWGFELPLTAHLEENGLPMQHRGDKKPNTDDKEDVQNSVWCDHRRLSKDTDYDDGGRHHNHYLEEENKLASSKLR